MTENKKNHYIAILPNKFDDLNIGTFINIKTFIAGSSSPFLFNSDYLNNKIILSIVNPGLVGSELNPLTLLSQKNLFENIKIVHSNTNNDLNNQRILIVKNNNNTSINTTDPSKNYLINNLSNFEFTNNISFNIDNGFEQLKANSNLNSLILYNNYYIPCNNSDYYRFKFSDFAHELEIDNSYKFKLVGDISLINNYNISYDDKKFDKFKTLYNFNDNGNIILDKDISNISKLDSKNYYDNSSDNILIYNQHENTSIVRFELNSTSTTTSNPIIIIDSSYIFFKLVRDYGYQNNNTGKIYFNENLLYFNTNVISKGNNFYNINKHLDENMVYLSFGKNITGITKYNIDSKMIFKLNDNKLDKIYFKNIFNNIANNQEKYLVNENYNFNYTNILCNTITNNIDKKDLNIDIKEFFDISNIYKNEFNSYALINNTISGTKLQLTNNISNYWNNNYNDISFNYINKTKIINDNNTQILNDIRVDILENEYKINYLNFYNSIIFDISASLKYNINDDDSIVFFNNIYITNYLEVVDINDFRYINCLFTYYNPYDESTPAEYRYPNNNIDICSNPSIASLSRAIELIRRGSRQSNTNSVIIPSKNNSNLSKKSIQGLIGMNKIAKLLSIEPYDENFIIGRGFINQYQIIDTCKTDTEIINNKYTSQKNSNIKYKQDNFFSTYNISKKQAYANSVRNSNSRVRNNRINSLTSCKLNTNLPETPENYITRFTNQMWKR